MYATYRIVVFTLRVCCRKIRSVLFNQELNGVVRGESQDLPMYVSALPRKTSKVMHYYSVPQTDTGGRVEKTKANK